MTKFDVSVMKRRVKQVPDVSFHGTETWNRQHIDFKSIIEAFENSETVSQMFCDPGSVSDTVSYAAAKIAVADKNAFVVLHSTSSVGDNNVAIVFRDAKISGTTHVTLQIGQAKRSCPLIPIAANVARRVTFKSLSRPPSALIPPASSEVKRKQARASTDSNKKSKPDASASDRHLLPEMTPEPSPTTVHQVKEKSLSHVSGLMSLPSKPPPRPPVLPKKKKKKKGGKKKNDDSMPVSTCAPQSKVEEAKPSSSEIPPTSTDSKRPRPPQRTGSYKNNRRRLRSRINKMTEKPSGEKSAKDPQVHSFTCHFL